MQAALIPKICQPVNWVKKISEARRNVEQGGVSADGTQIKDIKAVFAKDQFAGDGVVIKRGKKNFKKVILK